MKNKILKGILYLFLATIMPLALIIYILKESMHLADSIGEWIDGKIRLD